MVSRLLFTIILLVSRSQVMAGDVTIGTDFPGGNALVERIDGVNVRLAPDLRGGKPWFYWCFDAESAKPGRVTFSFAKPSMIGVQGPAVSMDGGRSWRWLGDEHVESTKEGSQFSYEFREARQRVRFAVAIPYLQNDLDDFMAKQVANPHLTKSELAKTRKGTTVDLLRIGKPGQGVQSMMVTARHHACESMASYVLEGFLAEAMSDSVAARAFRERYVLYAVPIVDKDGVQAGDQGKNRSPHDHNRDYGAEPLYPEIRAIQDLADEKDIRFAIDFHCPALRGDIHEAFHFLGLGLPHVRENLQEWISWIKEERPQEVMAPLDFLVDSKKPNAVDRRINSHYMATRPRAILAATLEVPYTQVKPALDPAMARAYGAGLLRAWVRTMFIPQGHEGQRGEAGYAKFQQFRTEFLKTYRSQPKVAEAMTKAYLQADSQPLYRVESKLLLATLRLRETQFAEARSLSEAVVRDANATAQQRAAAMVLQVQVISSDPQSTSTDVDAALEAALRFPHAALDQRARCYEAVAEFDRKHHQFRRAIEATHKQIQLAASYEVGKLWNQIATDHDELKQPALALKARQEAVQWLRPRLTPVPVSVFGGMMVTDLFEALQGIPDTPRTDLRAAGQMVLDHKVVSEAKKEQIRKALAAAEKK